MSIFSTTANTQFNSFDDPFNSMNMNRGSWGMNSNYLTPSYDAPYRPAYQGGQMGGGGQNRGIFGSAGGLLFGNTQYSVGSQRQDSQYFDNISNRLSDGGLMVGQKFIFPVAAFAASSAFSSSIRRPIESGAARGLYGGAAQFGSWATGGSKAESAAAYARAAGSQGLFTSWGERMGMGTTEGVLKGAGSFMGRDLAGSMAGRAAVSGMGLAGGIIGDAAFTTGLAGAAMLGAQKFLFDPAMNIREGQNVARRNLSGLTFNEGVGDVYTGGGLSRAAGARMGTRLSGIGMTDSMFSGKDVNSMFDMSSQMGLMDNIGAGGMEKRMKSIVSQVKMIMSITQTPDFKETIQMMARMQQGGAQVGEMSGMMGRMGGLSAAAGISTNRMMSTVGSQAQYMFQANGMTPFLGQNVAASAMAGFSAANRSGLLSPALLAQMGGVEGATQSAVGAQVGMAQTPYNMMRMSNRYMTGRGGNDVVGNVSNFGMAAASNPMDMYGSMMLNKGMLSSQQFKDDGPMAGMNQLKEISAINPLTRGRKISSGEAYSMMTGMMGLSHEQAQAAIAQQLSMSDPKSNAQQIAGINRQMVETTRDYAEQQGNTRIQAFFSPATKTYRNMRDNANEIVGETIQSISGLTDKLYGAYSDFNLGGKNGSQNYNDLSKTTSGQYFKGFFDTDRKNVNYKQMRNAGVLNTLSSRINDMGRAGNQTASRVLSATTTKDRADAIYDLAQEGGLPKAYLNSESNMKLAEALGDLGHTSESTTGGFDIYQGRLDKVAGLESTLLPAGLDNLEKRAAIDASNRLVRSKDYASKQSQEDAHLLVRMGLSSSTKASVLGVAANIAGSAADMRVSTDSPLAKFGGDPDKIKKLAADPTTRSQVIKPGSDLEKKYLAAGTEKEKARILDEALAAGDPNRELISPGTDSVNSNSKLGDKIAFQDSQKGMRDAKSDIMKMMKEGIIDPSAGMGMLNSLDMKESTNKFGEAVKTFSDKVDEMNGIKEKKAENETGSSWFRNPFTSKTNKTGGHD